MTRQALLGSVAVDFFLHAFGASNIECEVRIQLFFRGDGADVGGGRCSHGVITWWDHIDGQWLGMFNASLSPCMPALRNLTMLLTITLTCFLLFDSHNPAWPASILLKLQDLLSPALHCLSLPSCICFPLCNNFFVFHDTPRGAGLYLHTLLLGLLSKYFRGGLTCMLLSSKVECDPGPPVMPSQDMEFWVANLVPVRLLCAVLWPNCIDHNEELQNCGGMQDHRTYVSLEYMSAIVL